MGKFCGKCGAPLDSFGKCPNCDKRKAKRKRRAVISIVLCVVIILGMASGYFALTFKAAAVTNDYTEDGVSAEGLAVNDKKENDNENSVVLSSNVKVFDGDAAKQINDNIQNIELRTNELCFDIKKGTGFDSLGGGDLFYLEGTDDAPLGDTYIGKIASKTETDDTIKFYVEAPMTDEVFDALKINIEEDLTNSKIAEIETIPGVSVEYSDNISEAVSQVSESGEELKITPLLYDGKNSVNSEFTAISSESDGLVFDLDVDLLDVYGIKEYKGNNPVGFKKYEYSEGYRVNVYITESGKRYHKENCSCLYASKEKISLADAVNEGYEPCFLCVPPILNGEKSNFNADAELKLHGKLGVENLKFDFDFDWDILNGKGIEQLSAQAQGDALAHFEVESKLKLEIGGETTTITMPIDNIKLQGLKEKLFPIAFVTYNGVSFDATFSNDGIREKTGAVPLTVGLLIYADLSGNITLSATASVNFDYSFDCSYTGVKDGEWVNEWNCSNEPVLKTALNIQEKGELDGNAGISLSVYVFNLNVTEWAIIKIGLEAEGELSLSHETTYKKGEDGLGKTVESDASFDGHMRVYLKISELALKLKTKIKIGSLVDLSNNINEIFIWLDITVAEWGTRKETRFDSSTMEYRPVCAKDEKAVYYKDTNGDLIRAENGKKTLLYENDFFSICGIDESYIYITVPGEAAYDIYRVSKTTASSKVIVEDVSIMLAMDEKYLYYVSSFDSTSIVRTERETLKESQFAKFDNSVEVMGKQENGWYVVTKETGIFSIFGSAPECFLLNDSGGVIHEYGSSPKITEYFLFNKGTYYAAKNIVSNGYLRGAASEVYWLSADKKSSVLAEGISGWSSCDCGIFTTHSSADGEYEIVLYRASDGQCVNVTDVKSDQAFFTLCQSRNGEWYFFDQTDDELILYKMSEDFGSKTELKRFGETEMPCKLTDCAMVIMNNTIYFYSMPNETTSNVLYRYNITGSGGGF